MTLCLLIINSSQSLSKKQVSFIVKKGLIHYTNADACKLITKTRIFLPTKSKRKSLLRINKIYLFKNTNIPINILEYNGVKKCSVKMTVTNLTVEQVNSLKVRFFDNALIHRGAFRLLEENSLLSEDFDINRLNVSNISSRFRFIYCSAFASIATILVACCVLLVIL